MIFFNILKTSLFMERPSYYKRSIRLGWRYHTQNTQR